MEYGIELNNDSAVDLYWAAGGNDSYDYYEDLCSIIPPEFIRLVLVGMCGSSISFVSFVLNSLLFTVLVSNPRHHSSHVLYLIWLALFDIFISVSYIMLFPVNLFMDWFASIPLAAAWWTYMRPMLATCHVTMTASVFLILAAAFERYITISKFQLRFRRRHRLWIIGVAMVVAVIAKGPVYFELKVVPNANCTGVTANLAVLSDFSNREPYKTVYRFWFRNAATIFIPFFLCLYFNTRIVIKLRQQHTGARLFRFGTSEHKRLKGLKARRRKISSSAKEEAELQQNIRSATRMLVLVTCTYLLSNVLNVVVTAWEFIDLHSLLHPQMRPFYTYSSDFVSVLTVLSSAARLPIYCSCNARLRAEVFGTVLKVCGFQSSKWVPEFSFSSTSQPTVKYSNTNGLVIENGRTKSTKRAACVGTGLDKIALSVAMAHLMSRHESMGSAGRMNNELVDDVDDDDDDDDDQTRPIVELSPMLSSHYSDLQLEEVPLSAELTRWQVPL
uniref:G-protein coupled receptors family 1 profile domain-containing protein n=1 Tax=Plectus sambesii TaxID=2011161 RepID=A0A914US54_9BILA